MEHPGSPQATFLAWARQNAVHLDASDCAASDSTRLRFLDGALKGKRIVYLGESDHYVHEKYPYRLRLIRYLFEKHGFNYLGMEGGWAGGRRVDEYLRTGDAANLKRLTWPPRRGRNDMAGYLSNMPIMKRGKSAVRRNGLAEQTRFLEDLRDLSARAGDPAKRLHFFCFGVDLYPGGGYEDVRALLYAYRADPLVKEVLLRLKLVKGETISQEIDRLKSLERFIKTKASRLNTVTNGQLPAILFDLRSLKDSFVFVRDAFGTDVAWLVSCAVQERERTMKWQMKELLDKLSPNDKVILMGHNYHLSKDYTKLSSQADSMWPSIGTYIQRRLQQNVYAIWLLYDQGWHLDLLTDRTVKVDSDSRRVEHLLAQVGDLFMLPTAGPGPGGRYLSKRLRFGQNGHLGSGNLAAQADAVYFTAHVTPPADVRSN